MGCSLSFLGVHSCLYAMVKVFQRKMLNLSKILFLATLINKMIAIKTILVASPISLQPPPPFHKKAKQNPPINGKTFHVQVHELGSKVNS